jgi:hypothetical protein
MDSKGAFLSALNGAMLGFLWSGLKVEAWCGFPKYAAIAATTASVSALMSALLVILPREKLSVLVGRKSPWKMEYQPLSFYGYIAKKYGNAGKQGFKEMVRDCQAAEEKDFAFEALEQHYAISCVVQRKSDWVFRAGFLTLTSLACIGVAMFVKLVWE